MPNVPRKLFFLVLFALLLFIFTPKAVFAQATPWWRWYRSIGVDMRDDKGFEDRIRWNTPPPYASLPGSEGAGMPGIIFSGDGAPNFWEGLASDPSNWNWKVEDAPLATRQIQTSYNFLLAAAENSKITTIPIAVPVDHIIDLSSIPAYPATDNVGVYTIDAGTDFDGTPREVETEKNNPITITSGNYIFLIKGSLRIWDDIIVEPGATAIFSASEDILVQAPDIDSEANGTNRIEGLYSADCRFITDECLCGADEPLVVYGTVIANAGRRGPNTCEYISDQILEEGYFAHLRNLDYPGGGVYLNWKTPSFIVSERPDFILNYPAIVTRTNSYWEEVAP